MILAEESLQEQHMLYREYEKSIRTKLLRLVCALTLISYPIFAINDYLAYPELHHEFTRFRYLSGTSLVAAIALTFSGLYQNHFRFLSFLIALTPLFPVAAMIAATGGEESIFFVGLILVAIPMILVFPTNITDIVAYGIMVILIYWLSCRFHLGYSPDTGGDMQLFIHRSTAIVVAMLIALIAWYLHENRRRQLFLANKKLERTNERQKDLLAELDRTRSALIQEEKMRAVGRMSGGIMHEINNPLNGISMLVDVMESNSTIKADKELREMVTDLKVSSARISSVVKDLKMFAYPSSLEDRTDFYVEEMFEKSVLVANVTEAGVAIQLNLLPDTRIRGARSQLIQAIANLLQNSIGAIDQSGRQDGKITINQTLSGNRSVFSISDNGIGIEQDDMSKIFDPFFTTRDIGSGVGLGLSTAKSILSEHGSLLLCASQVNVGSIFSFDLPMPETETSISGK
ncbi:MAG: ATP-binding protein [Pseudomonadota bacterium]